MKLVAKIGTTYALAVFAALVVVILSPLRWLYEDLRHWRDIF